MAGTLCEQGPPRPPCQAGPPGGLPLGEAALCSPPVLHSPPRTNADVAVVDSQDKIIVVGHVFFCVSLRHDFFLANLFSSPPPPK